MLAMKWLRRAAILGGCLLAAGLLQLMSIILGWLAAISPELRSLVVFQLVSVCGVLTVYAIARIWWYPPAKLLEDMPDDMSRLKVEQYRNWLVQAERMLARIGHKARRRGVPKGAIAAVDEAIAQLRNRRRVSSSHKGEFDATGEDQSVQEALRPFDEECRQIVRKEAIRVAAGTLASPYPMLDAAIVCWRSMALVHCIAGVYGMRPTFGRFFRVLSDVLASAGLAAAMERYDEGLRSINRNLGDAVAESKWAKVAVGVLTGATVELTKALANGMLTLYIGNSAVEACRSLRKITTDQRRVIARNARQQTAANQAEVLEGIAADLNDRGMAVSAKIASTIGKVRAKIHGSKIDRFPEEVGQADGRREVSEFVVETE